MACYTKHKMRATASCMIPAVSRSFFGLISALLMLHCVSVAPTCASFLREQQPATTTTTTTATTATATTSVGVAAANDFLIVSVNDKNDENSIYFGPSVSDSSDLLIAGGSPTTTTTTMMMTTPTTRTMTTTTTTTRTMTTTTTVPPIASDLTTVAEDENHEETQQISSDEGGIGGLLKQIFTNDDDGIDTTNAEFTTTEFFDASSDYNIESEENRSTTAGTAATSSIMIDKAANDKAEAVDTTTTTATTTATTELNDAGGVVDSAAYSVFLAAEAAASAESDDPRFDWDTSLPGAVTSCFFTGLPVTADNGVILRFSGAAVRMANANYPFRALHECGVITDSTECGEYVLSDTESTTPCTWQTNSQSLGSKYGTASCSSVPTTALELSVGMSTWFAALERYEANGYLNVSDEQIFMREEELADCLQYTAEGPDVCNSKTDSRGHPCTMCEKVPYDYYPFLEAPMDPDDSNYIRLCLADYTFPTFCNMFRQITTMCGSGEYWEPTYDTTSTTTTTLGPDATTITTTTTTTTLGPDATTITTTTTTVGPDATPTTTLGGSFASSTTQENPDATDSTTTAFQESSDATDSTTTAATISTVSARSAAKSVDGHWLLNASATAAVLLAALL